jgi:hypothetical protein
MVMGQRAVRKHDILPDVARANIDDGARHITHHRGAASLIQLPIQLHIVLPVSTISSSGGASDGTKDTMVV